MSSLCTKELLPVPVHMMSTQKALARELTVMASVSASTNRKQLVEVECRIGSFSKICILMPSVVSETQTAPMGILDPQKTSKLVFQEVKAPSQCYALVSRSKSLVSKCVLSYKLFNENVSLPKNDLVP